MLFIKSLTILKRKDSIPGEVHSFYRGYTGMWAPKVGVFSAVLLRNGMSILAVLVINRVLGIIFVL